MPTFSFLRSRLARLLANDPNQAAVGANPAVARRRGYRPSVRRLEPRFVLNASAELTSLGQLVITGSDAADYVRLDVNSLGQITLQDAFGDRIEIAGNPNGQSEPLNPTDIFSKQIQINLLDGHDTLDLAIPSGLNVSVIDGGGFDTINIFRPDSLLPNESATHQLNAQAIRFYSSDQPLDWRNQNFQLSGNVLVGAAFSPIRTDILIDGGSWEVEGRLILRSDVGFFANTNGGSIDLSNATITADRSVTTLTVDLGNADTALLQIGNVDDSASHSITNLSVKSAYRVDLQAENFGLPGELSIQNVSDAINIGSQISASNISLQASTIRFLDSSIMAMTGDIHIDGPVTLIGNLDVRTTNGDITFTNTIDGNHQLFIDAGAGVVALQNDLGGTEALSNIEIAANTITTQSLTTQDGNITLGANTIDFTGQTISTLDSGDLSINGDLAIIMPTANITSAGTVKFSGLIRGNLGTEILIITANDRIDLNANTQQIGSLSLLANDTIQTSGSINVNQNFTAKSAVLLIKSDITLQADFSGLIMLDGKDLIQVDSGAILSIANGMLVIDTEGKVDLANSTIVSDSSDAVISARAATTITLGNIRIENGLVDLQTIAVPPATVGEVIGQAKDTSIVASKLRISAGGDVVLLNKYNNFKILENIVVQGDLLIRDDIGDMTIERAVVFGTTVDVFTDRTLFLQEKAITAGEADVHLKAGMSIINAAGDVNQFNISGKTLNATAGTGIGGVDHPLRTAIDRLTAKVLSTGMINIAADDSIELRQVTTVDGPIHVTAGDSIVVSDIDSQNDLQEPLYGPEIMAGGDNGRITLIAKNRIELENQTQIVAAQSKHGAVRLESEEVVFGETIEIKTGSGVGIAKHFLPRPATEQMDTAFYDETTIRTDVLTQENSNDAKGFLTLRVGLPGERGFQVDIDWGAPTNRFQTITNVSADNSRLVDGRVDISGPITDNPLLRVSHVYLESDILDSVLNGRTSVTSPLNVRFAVSHHESIIVQAGIITQGFDEAGDPLSAEIAGRLASSTDNPLTVDVFESGTARFIIPNLTIPVAFFPVREIIPEPVKLESFARPLETVLISSGSVESESGSASSSATGDEYFQIRILSPDPTGEDLADPKRLPDDILSGDKLQRLFESLPDGRYEVDYVFGDGNVRSLLMIDNRDGEIKVLGQEIKGGPLRLERLSQAELDLQPMTDNPPQSGISIEMIPSPPEIEPNNDTQGDEKESPNVEDQGFRPVKTSFESLAIATIAGGFLADTSVNRFSIVGRYLLRPRK